MNEKELAVEIENLGFRYPTMRDVFAVRGVSVEISRGEFVAMIGQNGSGKSTLAKCISGFLKPSEGWMKILGRSLRDIRPSEHAKHVGYIFQNPDHQLFRDTVWDEITFGMQNLGLPDDLVSERAHDALHHLQLDSYRELHPHRLSKGDKQRLAVAAIVVMNPPVIVVDEPTTGQDPQRARDVMEMLTRMRQNSGTTVVVITHDMELVAEFAERAIVLCEGRILLDCSVRDAFSQPEILRQTYIEPPFVARLGVAVGLEPIPLTVAEAGRLIISGVKS